MKTSNIVIIVIIFLLIVGGILFVYFRYELPKKQERIEFVNLNILAIRKDNLLVKTGYTVFVDNYFFTAGNTSDRAAVLVRVPLNSSITIVNKNLENQSYYINEQNTTTFINEPKRVVLELISVGNLNVTHNGTFGIGDEINLSILSEGYFKNMTICLDWSTHVLLAKIENLPKIEKIDKNVKCFSSKTLEENEEINFTIVYNSFGYIDEKDFIDVNFYDFDDNYILRQTYEINRFK